MTFSGVGFVLLTVNVTVIVVNFLLVDNTNSGRRSFSTSVFDAHHVMITPAIALVNFLSVVCTIVHGPGSGWRFVIGVRVWVE